MSSSGPLHQLRFDVPARAWAHTDTSTARRGAAPGDIPCTGDPELWFAETPEGLEEAKSLCGRCPWRAMCLEGALERGEPWGVWGGELFDHGRVIERKRTVGRPRKDRAA